MIEEIGSRGLVKVVDNDFIREVGSNMRCVFLCERI